MLKKVAIIGVGLIGGSIGLALKKKRLAKEVVGVCRHKKSLRRARLKGAIDSGTLDYKKAVEGADLVVLATPVSQIISFGKKIAPYLKKGCLVTDAGSTKEMIVSEIEKASSGKFSFVGAHPLAGSEKRGVGQARADLFKGALCLLTKTKNTNARALKKIVNFWKAIGCRIEVLTPQRHDEIVALISHLPHLVAGQLVNVAKSSLSFAAGGFLDSTRIASSDSEVWTDIFLTNRRSIIRIVYKYIYHLKRVARLIQSENKSKIRAECKKMKELRDVLNR